MKQKSPLSEFIDPKFKLGDIVYYSGEEGLFRIASVVLIPVWEEDIRTDYGRVAYCIQSALLGLDGPIIDKIIEEHELTHFNNKITFKNR